MGGLEEGGPSFAVIGMSGRFPGAPNVGVLWENLRRGAEAIRFFSDEELLAAGDSPERLGDPSYVKASGYLDDIDKFDAAFFGMSPRDAAVFDPQHRCFLECAWRAFEDAGYVGESFPGRVAVFGACGAAEYLMQNLLPNRRIMETVGAWLVRHLGNDPNFLATRVSYELNLRGPSMNVQTACSSSLVAVHAACQSLLAGECDLALAGGSTIYPDQGRGYFYKEGEILSPDGHCRPFDARSAGTVMSSAVACVLVRRLEDAIRDGDRILAIIRGSAINNDGSEKVGYLAPSVSGQAQVVSEALAVAGVDAEDVSYVEAHGTATLLGDPIEVTGLTEAFRERTRKKQFCAIGSLKSNIGHTGEAAGVCGLIKTILALEHKELPPSLHYEAPNPQIDFANSPFYVNAKLQPWAATPGKPRIAGVTALGAGGTNAHVLLQEAPPPPPPSPARASQLLVLSARTPEALETATSELAAFLDAAPPVSLADVAHTLIAGRKGFAHRRAVVADGLADAARALRGADPKRVTTQQRPEDAPSVAFLFPGGGAQYATMGAQLYETEAVYRGAFDECLSQLQPTLAKEIRSLCFAGRTEAAAASARLESPSLSLPALFATEYAVAKQLASWGVVPAALIGHSAGEYAAACIAGVLGVGDAIRLVALRGQLFETLPDGGMLSVALTEEAARPLLGAELSFAAINAPSLCVLSGPVAAIARAQEELSRRDVECTRIHIRVAAHSAMLEPILDEFGRFCRTIRFQPPSVPFVSNLTGAWIADREATDPTYWVRHLRGTVRFDEGLRALLADANRALVEIGPGRTLSSLARQQPVKAALVTQTMRHPQEEAADTTFLLGAAGRLWTCGVGLDDAALGGTGRRRVALPTYPFERRRYWIDPDPPAARHTSGQAAQKRADIREWFYAPSWMRAPSAPPQPAQAQHTWLVFADESAFTDSVVGALQARGDRVIRVAAGLQEAKRNDSSYVVVPNRRSDYDFLAMNLRESGISPDRVLHMWACTPRPGRWPTTRLRRRDALAAYDDDLARHYYSLLFATQVFAGDAESLRVFVVSSHMQAFPGDVGLEPEKAVLQGPCKVIPREYPGAACTTIDVVLPTDAAEESALASRVLAELCSDPTEDEVILRDRGRWTRRLAPSPLPPRAPDAPSALRHGGVYLVTGGLGGIGLAVAEHLARVARARLVLVGRTALPPDDKFDDWCASHGEDDETSRRIARVRVIRELTEVIHVAADVTDIDAMRRVVSDARARFGAIHGVFHTAGVLKDELIALREPVPRSQVIDAKVKGALVLDAVLDGADLDLFVLFSSVSSTLGLPGQSDYTAANAFLDAFAHARAAASPEQHTLSIDWNAWQDVGMLARLVRSGQAQSVRPPKASGPRLTVHPMLHEVVSEEGSAVVFRSACRVRDMWTLSEHVVRGGDAVIPGTGFLELARAAVAQRVVRTLERSERSDDTPKRRTLERSESSVDTRDFEGGAVELRDVVFLAPFSVGADETRTLHVRIDSGRAFAIYGESPQETFVTGTGARVDAGPSRYADLDEVRARCARAGDVRDGFLVQHFMTFGPRWGNVRRVALGDGEGLLDLHLPDAFAADLGVYALHPALLDMATGGAQALLRDFDPQASFYVPFSYARVVVRRPLPASVSSHVRLREEGGRDSAVFDAILYDEHGEEVASIEGFVMRRARAGFAAAARRAANAPPSTRGHVESAQEAALRRGMTEREGLEALDRMLAARFSPQIAACTVDIHAWLAEVAAGARAGSDAEAEGAGPVFARPNVGSAFVAPRDDVERELAAMWRHLLGAAEVGIHDDYFELGGQSLVAVRLFHRITKTWGVELPMATLFQAPTIAQCADILRSRLGLQGPGEAQSEAASDAQGEGPPSPATAPKSERAHKTLVTIQKGAALIPFFCVHGAHGNVLVFRDLSRAMSPSQPFYGLQAYGVDGVTRAHETIEAMAEAYLEEVRQAQPHGPYLLGGYSGGGVVAFEMAQRITRAGEEVALLALLDTPNPQMPIRRITPLTRLLGDGFQVRLQRAVSGGVPYIVGAIRRKRDEAREIARVAREEREIDAIRARGETLPLALRGEEMRRNFERAFALYRPKPWPGRAVLFRARDVDFLFAEGGRAYGWDRHILGGVDVIEVPGNHHTVLLGANAEVLVRSLGRAIEDAQRQVGQVGPSSQRASRRSA